MQKDNLVYIKHIRDSIYKIENFTSGLSKEDFLSEENQVVQSGVVRELEVIGEATGKISAEYRQSHGDVPWRDMIDTRNKVIHDYLSIDYDLIWDIVQKDLPNLKLQLEKLLG